ncbi:MAG: filamentous hemagglutinin N-terminal domain-containing protein [Zoogloea sp.]|nr:filamentous hemagglutinin N-terminal domain-containing protein [Zoogloea sp.]
MKANFAASVAVLALALPFAAWAQSGLPTGANVIAGSATIANSATSMTVTTTSQRTIINYNGFSVGAGNSVRFNQPSSSSATLNRVLGSEGSAILGSVTSNGQIFLVNPNGIFVGPSGSFSGSSVYLSTGNIRDTDFLGGNIRFDPPPSDSTIRFAGTIDATDVIRFNSSVLDFRGTVNNHGGTLILDPDNIVFPTEPITTPPISLTPPLQESVGNISINGSGAGGNLSLSGGTVLSGPPPTVSGGSVVISSGASGLTVQNTNGAIINWSTFSIGAGQTTHFAQPSTASAVLNRVLNDPSTIVGKLTSNGSVWLVNPAGIFVGPGKVVNVSAIRSVMKLVPTAAPTPLPMATPVPSLPPAAPPAVASIPRGSSSLVDGVVTVRLSLVDATPITLR